MPAAEAQAESENPGALAGATGADQLKKSKKTLRENHSWKRPAPASGNGLGGEWKHSRWAWKRAVQRDPRLTRTDKQIAVGLLYDFANHASGRCNPKIATICEATGYAERTVQKTLAQLEACGWIVRSKGRGRGRASDLIFTADAGAGAIIAQNVTELAPYREPASGDCRAERVQQRPAPDSRLERVPDHTRSGAHANAKRVHPVHPIEAEPAGERVHRATQMGAPGCGSLLTKEPNLNQSAGAAARERGEPRRPTLNLRGVAYPGSDREALWNEWLNRKGWPSLVELGVTARDAGGAGWEVPFREPPCDNSLEERITATWLEWAAWHMEARLAATG